jgi:hypothetical protein
MQSNATTVQEYLAELPQDRRAALEAVRRVILDSLDTNYEERMQYGMIGYVVPHRVYPPGYHCDPKLPLPFAALAAQKNHLSLYLMCLYGDRDEQERFREAWAAAGKKLDMGKSCIRFRKAEDLVLPVIAEAIRRFPATKYVKQYEASLAAPRRTKRREASRPGPRGAKSKD